MASRALLALAATLVASLCLIGAWAPPSRAQTPAVVVIEGFLYKPNPLTVTAGTPVTWTNRDAAPHTATAAGGAFDSGTLETGRTFTFTPRQAGTLTYRCDIHPEMAGTLIVVAAGAPAPAAAANLTPNGPWIAGANSVVVQHGATAAQIAAAAATASGRTVTALWYLTGGRWTYYLPSLPGLDGGLAGVPPPVSSILIVLA